MDHLRRAVLTATVGAAIAALLPSSSPVGAQGERAGAPNGARALITSWAPAYSAPLPIPDNDGSIALAADDTRLWLATETEVALLEDGVWRERQSPPGVSKIFALAVAGTDVWAFGFEGGIWRRSEGRWASVPSPVAGDLYAAAARGPDDVWAVGFDFDAEQGTLVHFDGRAVQAFGASWLFRQQLFGLAAAPSGELWAGGCDYADNLVLLRDHGSGNWTTTPSPILKGCIYHLAFGADGSGLAAAGGDLLRWDGAQWHPENVAPPGGTQWVRVATTALAPSPSPDPRELGPGGEGYAIAGTPTWRGYSDGQPPWTFDGTAWQPATIENSNPLGASGEPTEPAPYVDLAADSRSVWTVQRFIDGQSSEGRAVVLQLDRGTARVHHPLLLASTSGDIAALPDGEVWIGGNRGGRPLLRRREESWAPAMPDLPGPAGKVRLTALDFATADAGWALGLIERADAPTPEARAWRWNGLSWAEAASPPPRMALVRALPDGSAWAASPGQGLSIYDPARDRWFIQADAPLPAPPPTIAQRNATPFARSWAPFDVQANGANIVAWIATESGIVRYPDRPSTPSSRPVRGQVVDLQLVDPQHGWAIAWDPAAEPPSRMTGVVLRLSAAGVWEELTPGRIDGLRGALRDVEWYAMAVVGPEEVWLYGMADLNGRQHGVLVRLASGAWAAYRLDCRIVALGANRVGRSGTDVWLLGPSLTGACLGGTGPDPITSVAGPVSRLSVHRVVDRLVLPLVQQWDRAAAQSEPAQELR